jgi:hypothetical protein
MLTRRALAILRMRSLIPRTARTLALLAGALLYVLAWLLAGQAGAWLALACNLVLAVFAWPVYSTLGGLVRWDRLTWGKRVLVGLVFLLGYVAPVLVIWRGFRASWRARRDALAKLHRPWFAGGTITVASVGGDRYYLQEGAEAFEDGTLNYLALPAITIGLEHLQRIGLDRIPHARDQPHRVALTGAHRAAPCERNSARAHLWTARHPRSRRDRGAQFLRPQWAFR